MKKKWIKIQLEEYGIEYQKIKPYTPRHNGKVERSNRNDNQYFYWTKNLGVFEEFEINLSEWNELSMRPLGFKSPKQVLATFFVTHV